MQRCDIHLTVTWFRADVSEEFHGSIDGFPLNLLDDDRCRMGCHCWMHQVQKIIGANGQITHASKNQCTTTTAIPDKRWSNKWSNTQAHKSIEGNSKNITTAEPIGFASIHEWFIVMQRKYTSINQPGRRQQQRWGNGRAKPKSKNVIQTKQPKQQH